MSTYQLHNTECLAWLAEQPAACFDAIIADPPYQTTNLAFDRAPGLDWVAFWEQAWRVVKPAGVVVLFAADLFTVDLILSQRANYRYRLVWEKTRKTGFLDAKRRPMRDIEDVVVFGRKPLEWTYNAQKTPRTGPNKTHLNKEGKAWSGQYGHHLDIDFVDDNLRYPGLVLRFGSGDNAKNLHPTQKPLDLMRWLVRTYTNEGDRVLDCFAGSGSTLAACLLEGRSSVGTELDPAYYEKAVRRLRALAAQPQLAFGKEAPHG